MNTEYINLKCNKKFIDWLLNIEYCTLTIEHWILYIKLNSEHFTVYIEHCKLTIEHWTWNNEYLTFCGK